MLIYTRHDPRHFDKRLHKGGDGGAAQMRSEEEARQRKVQQAVDAINTKFGAGAASSPSAPTQAQFTRSNALTDSTRFDEAGYNNAVQQWQAASGEAASAKTARDAMYTDISGAVRDTAMRDLDRQYGQASKKNTFGLARSGQLGGSVDAESGGELTELYGEGKLRATQAGQAAASDLRSTDEKTRQNLISLAQSGLDTGTAASMAAGQMSAAADLARGQAAGASVGRLFDDMTQAYATNQVMKTRYPAGVPQQSNTSYGYGGFAPSRYVGNTQP